MINFIVRIFKKITFHSIFYVKGGVAAAKYLGVKVGSGCRIYTKDFGSEPFLLSIGDNVTITSGVKILTHDGSLSLVRDGDGRRYIYKSVSIGDNVFIGVNAIILPGCDVGSNVVIAAGAVVTKPVPSGVVVAGNPAVVKCDFSEWISKKVNLPTDKDLKSALSYEMRVLKCMEIQKKNGY